VSMAQAATPRRFGRGAFTSKVHGIMRHDFLGGSTRMIWTRL
jgi:hypothetical protein